MLKRQHSNNTDLLSVARSVLLLQGEPVYLSYCYILEATVKSMARWCNG